MRFLTPEEAWQSLVAAAHQYLGMSGEAFIAAWAGGRFDDDPDQPALFRVSMLLPHWPVGRRGKPTYAEREISKGAKSFRRLCTAGSPAAKAAG